MAAGDSTEPRQQGYKKPKKGSTSKAGGSDEIYPETPDAPALLNCYTGDPTMFETYWKMNKFDHVMVRNASEGLSYFGDSKPPQGEFSGPPRFESVELDAAIRAIHGLVGNAVTEDKHIVVGHGSTQLYQAALFALTASPSDHLPVMGTESSTASTDGIPSTAVVAQSPFYSGYPEILCLLEPKRLRWAGDSQSYKPNKDEPVIEVITSPNNPCGQLREDVVKPEEVAKLHQIHDLAYYWPTYTPITKALDHDLMLFSLSKCTGHAGARIGWAIVKDETLAHKLSAFMVLTSIGVSQDAQSRAAGILRSIVRGYESAMMEVGTMEGTLVGKQLFHWAMAVMEGRWERVRAALAENKQFSIAHPQVPSLCNFSGMAYSTYPAFIWLKCEDEAADCFEVLKRNGILARKGADFGVSKQYTRVSLLGRKAAMDLLIQRLAGLEL